MLSLNQDGYVWQGDLQQRTFQELADYGYLLPLQDGNYLFRPDGEPEDCDVPAEREKVAELYNSNSQQDFSYVLGKLQSACLDDRMEDILTYWVEKYNKLQEIDRSKVKNLLKYDFSVILVWWLWDNFHFEPGDILEIGEGARLLRFHDEAFKLRIQNGARNRKITQICMDEKTVGPWNAALAAKKFEVPLENIAKILKKR